MPQSFNPLAVTALTTWSTSAGQIDKDAHNGFVVVTSTAAGNIVSLPKNSDVPVGWSTKVYVGATGFELRINPDDTAGKINNTSCSTGKEAAIPATTLVYVTKQASADWLALAFDEEGDDIAGITPD